MARMDRKAVVDQILPELTRELWISDHRQPCSIWLENITNDLISFDMQLLEARDAALNLSLEAAGFVQRYGLDNCGSQYSTERFHSDTAYRVITNEHNVPLPISRRPL